MKAWQLVDNALDVITSGTPGITFLRDDIAYEVGCTPAYASYLLQAHRQAQGRGVTRYVVAARGYARSAAWFVLAAPGVTLGTDERRRLTMSHGEHIGIDAARRVIKDITTELDPALAHHPAIQAYLTHASAGLEAQVRLMVQSVQNAVALVEATSGEHADRIKIQPMP